MEYRRLGSSGLQVSTLTLGTMTFGAKDGSRAGSADLDAARAQVDLALDAGVNLIDTADVYADGASEEVLGEVLKGRREDVLLTTKVRFTTGTGPNDLGLSRHHIVRGCEASLRRLQTDYLDLYQLHEWDGSTPLEETLEALDLLVRQGKVRYVGVSNYSGWHLMKALAISDRDHLPRFVSQQIYYSLQGRDAEYELVPVSVDQGVGILVWSPLAGGLLSGKYRRGQDAPEGARHVSGWTEPPVHDEDKLYDIVDVLVDIAEQRGVPPTQVALAWTLRKPAVTSLIVGARTLEQLTQNLGAADLVLDDAEFQRLEDVSRPPLLYPYWHQASCSPPRFTAADLTLLEKYRD